jgi:pimeloyl-ACP methyl ester carboxylesterase
MKAQYGENKVQYKTVNINGLDIFYRQAGNRGNPTILLLHGFPSSSHMYRNLINELQTNIILLLLTIQDLEIVTNLQ